MKTDIKNRHGLKIVVLVEGDLKSKDLVFITHGLTGSKDQIHIKGMREAFITAGFTVVSFDTTHAWGESDGDTINATATSYIEDLEDLIEWASQQSWYKEPFVLAGHSLGSISSLVYANKHQNKVKAIFPMSTVVSGKLWYEAADKDFLADLKNQGFYLKESQSIPGKKGKIGKGLAEDLQNYDALKFAPSIKYPVLLIVGKDDKGTSPAMHEMLQAKLGGPSELHIIPGMEHTPRDQKEVNIMKELIGQWLKKL